MLVAQEKKVYSMLGSYISPAEGVSWEIKDVYISAGMFFHQNYNWGLFGMLIVILLTNAYFRVQSLHCGTPIDILFGWSFGIIWAIGWYAIMAVIENQHDGAISLTYFGNEDGADKCKLTNKKFKCRKI